MFNAFGWLGCCWTWLCIWAWWRRRAQKILAYEAIEINRQHEMTIRPNQGAIRESNTLHRVATKVTIQRVATMIYVRFKVTICLYLSPNNRARSLSTLMAAIVNKDVRDNPYPEMKAATHANRQSLHSSKTTDIQRVAARGWLTRPTNRSLVARERYRSLDGGWRKDTLWSATKIREFPRNAVREKKMMTADRRSAYCSNSPAKEEEHTSSSNVFICVPSPVEFAAALRAPAQRWSLNDPRMSLSYSAMENPSSLRRTSFFTEVTLNITLCKFRCNE